MTGYSAFRIFEESLRVNPSEHFLGLRLNFYVASVLTVVGIAWFVRTQRARPVVTAAAPPGGESGPEGGDEGTAETRDEVIAATGHDDVAVDDAEADPEGAPEAEPADDDPARQH